MTDSSFPPVLPPPPDPVKVAQIAGQIRAFLPLVGGIAAGVGIAIPTFTDAQMTAWIYAAMILAGLGSYAWAAITSWQSKKADRAILVASTKASVQHGQAVVVTVTPPGMANVATAISQTEQRAAPSVPQGVAPQPAPAVP